MARIVRADDGLTLAHFHPRYWLVWLGLGFLLLLGWLPWAVQFRLGCFIGWLAFCVAKQRVDDTRINLRLCFPERSEAEREVMARDVFRQAGIGVFEVVRGWVRPKGSLNRYVTVIGAEHVREALAQGRGLLLLGMHTSHTDFAGVINAPLFGIHTVYRPQNNPVADYIVRRCRKPFYIGQIDHADMRSLLKALKAGEGVWTTVDQDFGLKQGVMAPFFGVPAATLTATARMAKVNNTPVLFVHFRRHDDTYHYTLEYTPVLAGYPSGDEVADATRLNLEIERLLRRAPTQYMWFHRRFKTRPVKGEPSFYQRKKRHKPWEKR